METLLISREDVQRLLTLEECIPAVEQAFRLRAEGKVQAPGILGVHATDGGFHIKAGILKLGREYFVAKANANFPGNLTKNGLPTIQGVIVVNDAQDGRLLALLDSIEITIIRTGAATAVAAKYLSRPESHTVTICGCGNQGKISLRALSVVRDIRKVFVFDIDEAAARKFKRDMSNVPNIDIEVVTDVRDGLRSSDIVVTCTSSKHYFINHEDITPGMFIAAVGSDNEDKQELDPLLLLRSKVVADSIEQASKIGELHHVLKAGLAMPGNMCCELGEVIAGIKPGRSSEDEVIIFDSTGTALQDVAASAVVYEKAHERSLGLKFTFAS
jgi:alanine dehydrogenase